MKRLTRVILFCLFAAVSVASSGCLSMDSFKPGNLFHELKPHRLWRFNRNKPPRNHGNYYSDSRTLFELNEVAEDVRPDSSVSLPSV